MTTTTEITEMSFDDALALSKRVAEVLIEQMRHTAESVIHQQLANAGITGSTEIAASAAEWFVRPISADTRNAQDDISNGVLDSIQRAAQHALAAQNA